MSEKTAKPNLFASAKKIESTKESKSKIPSLPVTPEQEVKLKEYTEAKEQVKNWESKKEIAEGFIKPLAIDSYLKEYRRLGRNIGSFKMCEVTFSVQDRYAKISDNVAAMIKKNFPNVVDETTEYVVGN